MVKWSVAIISYLIAIISFVFGGWDLLWEQLGVVVGNRPVMSLGLSLLVMLFGHFVSVQINEHTVLQSVSSIERDIKPIAEAIGHPEVKRLGDGEDALNYLIGKFPDTTSIINTRLPAPGATEYRTHNNLQYIQGFEKLVKRGVRVQEIAAGNFSNYCEKLSSLGKSTYKFKIIDPPPPSFINFSILTLENGSREVIFGWPVSEVEEFNAACFLSADNEVIALFETVFAEYSRG